MSNEKKFEVAVKRLAIRLNCMNADSIIISKNEDTKRLESYLVLRQDSNKVISLEGERVKMRNAKREGKQTGWRDFGTLDEFARALA